MPAPPPFFALPCGYKGVPCQFWLSPLHYDILFFYDLSYYQSLEMVSSGTPKKFLQASEIV